MATSTIKVNDKYVGQSLTNAARTTFFNEIVSSGKTRTFTVENAFRALMVINGHQTTELKGLYIVSFTQSGVGTKVDVFQATGVTITFGTNTVTVKNTGAANAWVNFLVMNGTVSSASAET